MKQAARCLLCLAFIFTQPCFSQETDEDLAFVEEAILSGYQGRYREAADDLEEYLVDFPGSTRAWQGLAGVERMRGRYEEGLKAAREWLALSPGHEDALVEVARMELLFGRTREAESLLREAMTAASTALKPRYHLTRLLFDTGRREEAAQLATDSLEAAPAGEEDGEGLYHESLLYTVLQDLDRAAMKAVYADERFNGRKGSQYKFNRCEALLVLGDLYRKTRLGSRGGDRGSGNRALDCFRDVLKINPNHPEALLGLALTRYYAFNLSKAMEHLDKILALNRVHAGALATRAHILSISGQFDPAMKSVEKGLAVNPDDKVLLAEKGAILLLRGEDEAFEEIMARIEGLDPTFGEAWYRVGELLIYRYRFADAETLLKRCIELDPGFSEAYIMLGRAMANMGREEEARALLEESMKHDPFDYPWRNNMLRVLSDLDAFLKVESDLFRLLLDVEETGVMRSYLLAMGMESFEILEKKYGFKVEGPILMEMFPDHRDFAVRTVGFTGLGALGACFGRVVTLLSPQSEPFRGTFNWASTLHHELCHVVTLQMSRNRIPRWFTEGISVFEEGQRKVSWQRNLDMELFNNYHNDRLFKMDSFDSGFMSSRIMFAYYQAGLAVKFMVERFGQDKVNEMILAFGKGLNNRRAVQIGTGLTEAGFDEAFRAWVWEEKLSSVKCVPFYSADRHEALVDEARNNPEDPEALLKAAWACQRNRKTIDALYYLNKVLEKAPDLPEALLLQGEIALGRGEEKQAAALLQKAVDAGVEDLFAYLHLGRMAHGKGDLQAAIALVRKAKDCFPSFIDGGSPRRYLIELYAEAEEPARAAGEMEQLLNAGAEDLFFTLKLVEYYQGEGNHEKAARWMEEAVQMDPFQRTFHLSLARELRFCGRYAQALDELDIALEIKPDKEPSQENPFAFLQPGLDENSFRANVYVERGLILLALDKRGAARLEAEKALLLKKGHTEAEALQKKLNDLEAGEGLHEKDQ